MISRDNYEIWFMDYADGNLSDGDRAMLREFLNKNPDLKWELDALLEECEPIPATHIIMPQDKNSLKKKIKSTGFIHENNYQEYFIAKTEDDLTAEDQNELTLFLDANPFLKTELEWFQKSRLVADAKIRFPHKRALKRRVNIDLRLSVLARYAAAAVLIGFIIYFTFNGENQESGALLSDKVNRNEINQKLESGITNTKESEKEKLERPNKNQLTKKPIKKGVQMPINVSSESEILIESKGFEPMALQTQNSLELDDVITKTDMISKTKEEENIPGLSVAQIFTGISGSPVIEKTVRGKKRISFFDFVKTGFDMASKRSDSNMKIMEENQESGRKKVHIFSPMFEAEFAMKADASAP